MPRPQSFNETDVIKNAMHLFWSQGYEATGLSQILESTKLKPGSFYNTFESKRTFFIRSLEYYRDQVVTARIADHLDAPGDPIDAIEDFFLSAFEPVPKSQMIGCLLTNTATEFGKMDAEFNKVVASGLRQIESAFKRRIIDAQALGLVDTKLDATAAALHLLASFQGMSVIGRLTQDKAKLRSITKTALSVLR